jgi:hypothetical protein
MTNSTDATGEPDGGKARIPHRVEAALSTCLAALCLAQLALWVPHYLTWPWHCDIDIFANQALAWDAGLLPYRETHQNNFPGQMYLLWVLGKTLGWGRPWTFWAADAGLIVLLGAVLVAWSRRRFGRALPALIGYLTLLGFQLEIDGFMSGQRDGQAVALAIISMLIAQGWPGRAGRLLSAITAGLAFVFRPQTVLLWPGILAALATDARGERGWGASFRAVAVWALALALTVAALFSPLVLAGVWSDFLAGIAVVLPGGSYGRFDPLRVLLAFGKQAANLGLVAVLVANILLAYRSRPEWKRVAWPWVLALLGTLLYLPLSPVHHPYLRVPLAYVFSINVAVLVGLVLHDPAFRAREQIVIVLLILGLQAKVLPRYSLIRSSWDAIRTLRAGVMPEHAPPCLVGVEAERWDGYRRTIEYLRAETAPSVRVANALKDLPAINGPAARVSPFPSPSMGWLCVNPREIDAYVRALEETPDSVVVWAPGDPYRLPVWNPVTFGVPFVDEGPLTRAIERLYEPAAKFGRIEVWSRKGSAMGAGASSSPPRRIE